MNICDVNVVSTLQHTCITRYYPAFSERVVLQQLSYGACSVLGFSVELLNVVIYGINEWCPDVSKSWTVPEQMFGVAPADVAPFMWAFVVTDSSCVLEPVWRTNTSS